jgi:xylulose-5-phosphate/fructose-6-phosphate phosphoketolase
MEEGTTTTPFDMVELSKVSRYHLAMEAIHRTPKFAEKGEAFVDWCEGKLREHSEYICKHLDDMRRLRNGN